METINLPKASALTSPNPVTLVCTRKPDGSTNLATVSWWTYLSFNPSMIAYAMAKTSFRSVPLAREPSSSIMPSWSSLMPSSFSEQHMP